MYTWQKPKILNNKTYFGEFPVAVINEDADDRRDFNWNNFLIAIAIIFLIFT